MRRYNITVEPAENPEYLDRIKIDEADNGEWTRYEDLAPFVNAYGSALRWNRFLVIVTFLLSIIVLSEPARADWAPYATGTLDYQINSLTSEYLRTDCKARVYPGKYGGEPIEICRGRNPLGELQVGVEFAFGSWRDHWYLPVFRAGWRHRSHLRDGVPFNDRPEVASESVFLQLKLGGLR